MMCNFTVGQKVVCVDEVRSSLRELASWFGITVPVKGGVYTIRKTGLYNGDPAVWLCEIVNPAVRYLNGEVMEQPFKAARFRPLVKRKTDISIFTAMLNPSKQGVPA
jgi:hypothetical protein